jgi:hypothetical protein
MPRMERAPSWLRASRVHQPSYSNFIPEGPDLMTCGCISQWSFHPSLHSWELNGGDLTQNVRRDGIAVCRRIESLARMQAAGVHRTRRRVILRNLKMTIETATSCDDGRARHLESLSCCTILKRSAVASSTRPDSSHNNTSLLNQTFIQLIT